MICSIFPQDAPGVMIRNWQLLYLVYRSPKRRDEQILSFSLPVRNSRSSNATNEPYWSVTDISMIWTFRPVLPRFLSKKR